MNKVITSKIDFEGTRILQKLAEINEVEAFLAALDANHFKEATDLMKRAQLNSETILMILERMAEINSANALQMKGNT